MDTLEPPHIPPVPGSYLWHRQALNVALLSLLVIGAVLAARPFLGRGEIAGLSDASLFVVGLVVPVGHQLVVALFWRAQLTHRVLSRWFGARDLTVWALMFMPFLIARPLVAIALAAANQDTLGLPWVIRWPLVVVFTVPALWTFSSVARYFGLWRAMGADHFRETYRALPMVRDGAFKVTDNAMYRLGAI